MVTIQGISAGMTDREVLDALLRTPTPRDERMANVAARLVFPRIDRVVIFILSFGLLPAFVGAVFGFAASIPGIPTVAIPDSFTPALSLAFLITWIGGTTFYVRRRHAQFVDVAQYGVVHHVLPIAIDTAAQRTSRRAILVGGYSGTLRTTGTNGFLVKLGNRRAIALHVNGVSASRVTWRTNVPTATVVDA